MLRNAALLPFIICLAICSNIATAQTTHSKWKFYAGADAGMITGSEQAYRSVALGATIGAQRNLSDHVALTFTTGFYDFLGKNYTDYSSHANTYYLAKASDFPIIPVKAGFKLFNYHQFYFTAEAGAGIELSQTALSTQASDTEYALVKLILSPGIGYILKRWDFALHYDNFSSDAKDHRLQNNTYGIAALSIGRQL